MKCLLKRLLPVAALGVFVFSSDCCAQAQGNTPKKFGWTIGMGVPSGSGVSDYYGSSWLDLQGSYRLRENEKCQHSLTFGITAGTKSKDFTVSSYYHPESEADYTARIISVDYNYKVKMPTHFYYGGGIGFNFVRTSAQYDAGDGYVWRYNNGRYITVSKTGTAIAPVLRVGYQVKEKVSVELSYTMFNMMLAGNTSSLSELPSVPDTKLNGLLKLNANFFL